MTDRPRSATGAVCGDRSCREYLSCLCVGARLRTSGEGSIRMQFQQFDLGASEAGGAAVVVTLRGNAANVRLLDPSNLSSYKNGKPHRYYGGLVKRSQHRIVVPRDGRWYVTVDLQGMSPRARVSASVQVEPAPLPVTRSADPISLSDIRVERPPTSIARGAWGVGCLHLTCKRRQG